MGVGPRLLQTVGRGLEGMKRMRRRRRRDSLESGAREGGVGGQDKEMKRERRR